MKKITTLILFFLIILNVNAFDYQTIAGFGLEDSLNKITKDTSTGEINVKEINADTIHSNIYIGKLVTPEIIADTIYTDVVLYNDSPVRDFASADEHSLITKSEAQALIPSGIRYYLTDNVCTYIAGCSQLQIEIPDSPAIQVAYNISNDGDSFGCWAECFGSRTGRLILGEYNFNIFLHYISASAKNITGYFEVVEYNFINGSETIVGTSSITGYIARNTPTRYRIPLNLSSDYIYSTATSFIYGRFIIFSTSGTADIYVSYLGTYNSHFAAPTNTEILNDIYLNLTGSNAVSNIDIGDYNFSSNEITADTMNALLIDLQTYSGTPNHNEGRMFWNSIDHTLNLMSDVNGPILQVGHEMWIRVFNNTGNAIGDGKAVRLSGVDFASTSFTIELSDCSNADSCGFIGLTTGTILNDSVGLVTLRGIVNDVQTDTWADNAKLYIGTKGELVDTIPAYPSYVIKVGEVAFSHATLGRINVDKGICVTEKVRFKTVDILEDLRVGDTINLTADGTDENSPELVMTANDGGINQSAYIQMVYGANPYFRIVMDTQQTGNLTTMDFSESTITPFVNDVTSLGTSSSKFNNVYANTIYGDGSNLTNILTTYDTTLLFDLVEDTTGATYWEIKASYYGLTNFDSYCYSFEITDTTTHAGETNIYVIRESEDISFNEDKTSIIFRSTLNTYYTNYLKGRIKKEAE